MTDTFPTIPDPNARQFSTSIFSSNLRDLILSTNSRREINPTPIKVLDAPELQDDFYLNLIDWGPNGCVAVGLGTCIYIWNSRTSIVTKLADLLNHKITSVSWNKLIPLLAVGVDDGRTLLYDVRQEGLIRTWDTHAGRVSALDWTHNVLTTGGRDHTIYHHDVRSPEPSFRTLTGHGAEVCGIKWSPDSSKLATGGNDNRLMIWNVTDSTPLYDFKHHTAAVKAIAWNPSRRGILVSGGGTADKTIKFWNTLNGKLLRSYNTGSQICNLSWLKRTGELVSTHGYADGAAKLCNQVFVWKPEQMRKLATLSGHTSRVLYMSVSPDERTIVTGAGDETLRFWDISSPEDEVAPEAPPSFESRSDQIR
ncbi:WD40-repeat-containing domain protein [Mycotypha africana]|uniref:WD40-repeat-containing domain protein n=1 Tax=Mycotypha africana TaxID=64632 RepID=UPI0023006B5C|nr:WD40-repeat-containing domain protein [Mycotypha africana]KAI8992166.1 WD40-repeat-containing domain protein [Mycotypha africana]